jgi:hypothetical protein
MTREPRRGRCVRCYQRAYHGRELARACACCTANPDPRALVRKRLASGMATLCGNCSAIAGRRPVSLEQLRAELRAAGGRRRADRRGADRRRLERRAGPELVDVERRARDRRAA